MSGSITGNNSTKNIKDAELRKELEVIKKTKPSDIKPGEVARAWKEALGNFDALITAQYGVMRKNPGAKIDSYYIKHLQGYVNEMIKANRRARRVLDDQQATCGQSKRWWVTTSLSVFDGIGGLCNVGLMLNDLIVDIKSQNSLGEENFNTTTITNLSLGKEGTSSYQIALLVIQAIASRTITHLHHQEEKYKKDLAELEDIVGKGESRAKVKHAGVEVGMLKARASNPMTSFEVKSSETEDKSSSDSSSESSASTMSESPSNRALDSLKNNKGCLCTKEEAIDLFDLKEMDERLSILHETYMGAMERGERKIKSKDDPDFSVEINVLSTVREQMIEIFNRVDQLPTKMPDLSCERSGNMWIQISIEAITAGITIWGLVEEIQDNTDVVLRVFILAMGIIVFFYSKGMNCFLIKGNNRAFAVLQVRRLQGLRRYVKGVEDLILYYTLCQNWKEAMDNRLRKKAYINVYKHVKYGGGNNPYALVNYKDATDALLLDSDADNLKPGDSDTTEQGMTVEIVSQRKKVVKKLSERTLGKKYHDSIIEKARKKVELVERQESEINDASRRSRSGSVELKDRVKIPRFQAIVHGVVKELRDSSRKMENKKSQGMVMQSAKWQKNRFWKAGGDSDGIESETTCSEFEVQMTTRGISDLKEVTISEFKESDEEHEEKIGGK